MCMQYDDFCFNKLCLKDEEELEVHERKKLKRMKAMDSDEEDEEGKFRNFHLFNSTNKHKYLNKLKKTN